MALEKRWLGYKFNAVSNDYACTRKLIPIEETVQANGKKTEEMMNISDSHCYL
jgi:hypothetical protein